MINKQFVELYFQYETALSENETLLEALKTLPEDMRLSMKLVSMGEGLPPMGQEKTMKERVEELEKDKTILTARVKAIKNKLIEELSK